MAEVTTPDYLANVDFRALGGAIGTGLFIGSGAILSLVGPAPLFMGYISNMGTLGQHCNKMNRTKLTLVV
jgi:hypothetical protein